jgi:hypothetical protein
LKLTNDAPDANKVRDVDMTLELLGTISAATVELAELVRVEAIDVKPPLTYVASQRIKNPDYGGSTYHCAEIPYRLRLLLHHPQRTAFLFP